MSAQEMHDLACKMGAKCGIEAANTDNDAAAGKSVDLAEADDTLVVFGGEVKALADGRVGGYLLRYSGTIDPDLTRDYFDAATNTGPHTVSPIYYQHGKDPQIKGRQIGTGSLRRDDVGVWVEAQLNLRDDYEKAIYQMAKDGKLGWSSGTAAHLVERERVGKSYHVKTWLLGLDASLTPTPAEPRNSALPLKSLFTEQSQGPDGRTDSAPEGAVSDEAKSATIPDELLALGLMVKRKAGTL